MTPLKDLKPIREIVLDTETTGLNFKSGDRIIEIGCVELINRVRTGETFHTYLNPMRDVNKEAFEIHGISTEFLQDKPTFPKVVSKFLEFIGNSTLIIHNAGFDIGFLNAELALCGLQEISISRAIDTLTIARKKFPGAPASLDALCKYYKISLESREKHGALTDADLLALVYIELMGGPQSSLNLNYTLNDNSNTLSNSNILKSFRESRNFKISEQDLHSHEEFLSKIKNPIWKKVNSN